MASFLKAGLPVLALLVLPFVITNGYYLDLLVLILIFRPRGLFGTRDE